jgi:excisionase family DNA binding protein
MPDTLPEQPTILTVRETAQALRVSESTVHRMIRDRELGSVRIRGCTRILGTEVLDLLGHQKGTADTD